MWRDAIQGARKYGKGKKFIVFTQSEEEMVDMKKKNQWKREYLLVKISAREVINFSPDFTHFQIELLILYPYLGVP